MKSLASTLLAVSFLPLSCLSADFPSALERMSVDRPEFVFYADIEDDFSSAGNFLTEAYLAYLATGPEIPPIPVDVRKVFQNLGFTGMTDLTITSSARQGNGFINQMMVRFKEQPSGLFLISGDTNQPFKILQEAPLDAELITEFRLSGNQLFEIIKNLVIDTMGPMGQGMIEGQLNQPVVPDGPTLAEIVDSLNTTVQFALKPHSGDSPTGMPPGLELLAGEAILRIEGIASILKPFTPMLAGAGFVEIDADGGQTWKLELPTEQFPLPVLLHTSEASGDVLVTLRETSKNWFLGSSDAPIATSEAFNEAVAGLPMNGLSFWYSSEKLGRMQIENLDSQLPMPELGPVIAVLQKYLLRFTGPQAGVSFLEKDAYRVVNYQPASYKTNVALAATLVPIGILSSLPQGPEPVEEDENAAPPASPAD